jgi:hypothetical protein
MFTGKQTLISIARLAALSMFAIAATAATSGQSASTIQQHPLLAGTGLLLIAIPRGFFSRRNKAGLFLVPQKTHTRGL